MHVEWTGQQTRDSETFSLVLQAKANGRNVSVYISQEAVDDGGVERCKSIAENKIEAETRNGEPPKRVNVFTSDLAKAR